MNKKALLVIDVQKGFDNPSWGKRNNPDAESNIASLISKWRKKAQPVIHVKHCSLEPNSLYVQAYPEMNSNKKQSRYLEKSNSTSMLIMH
jgi:nicotinamidase-related amidase